jgi:hypothetical protein
MVQRIDQLSSKNTGIAAIVDQLKLKEGGK